MPRFLILTALLAAVGCTRSAAPSDPAAVPNRPELWVDPGVQESGDGTRARPLRTLAEALQKEDGPLVIHLAVGRYPGPFELRDGLRLVGSGATVLFVEGEGPVLAPQGRLELEDLGVQGGSAGIVSTHALELKRVEFGGQQNAGIALDGGALRCEGCRFLAGGAEATGVIATGKARVELSGTAFAGPFRRGLHLEEGTSAQLTATRFEGPSTAVHSIRAELRGKGVKVSGGRAAGIFGSGGTVTLEDVEVEGHEYGVVLRDGSAVTMSDVRLSRPQRAALALVNVNARIDGLRITETGNFGGIHQLGGELHLTDFVIQSPDAYGINGGGARLRAQNGRIRRVTDVGGAAGDAIHLRRSRAVIEDVTVEDTAGSAVLAAEGSEVALRGLTTRRNKWGAVLAETGARVEVSQLSADSVPTVIAVPGGATVKVDGLTAVNVEQGLVWADCDAGAGVLLAGVEGKVEDAGTCVREWSPPTLFDPLAKPGAISSGASTP